MSTFFIFPIIAIAVLIAMAIASIVIVTKMQKNKTHNFVTKNMEHMKQISDEMQSMLKKNCEYCGAELNITDKKCANCGAVLKNNKK